MKMLLVAVAFATLVASPALAQSQTDQGPGASRIFVKQERQSRASDRCDPYFGTYWDGVAPYSSDACSDPYVGTPWDSVWPY
jgi:hypothetical protein